MRVLIMGGGGMLGHKLLQVFAGRFETWATARERSAAADVRGSTIVSGVNAESFDSIVKTFGRVRPDVVVNCIGIVKQRPEAKDPIVSLKVNSLLPHQLNELCVCSGARLIHVSTDCVFSGKRGNYSEADAPDPIDLYGHSKLLGEATNGGALTLRTSIIGPELGSSNGLVEWFLSQRGRTVQGFARAIFSGLPTIELAHVMAEIIEKHSSLCGLFHVGVDAISKYDLLRLLNEAFEADVDVQRNEEVMIDRSLDSSRFRENTGFKPMPWPALIQRMTTDAMSMDRWRRQMESL